MQRALQRLQLLVTSYQEELDATVDSLATLKYLQGSLDAEMRSEVSQPSCILPASRSLSYGR